MVPDRISRRRLAGVGFGLLAEFTALPFAGTYAGHLTAFTTRSLDPTVVDSTPADDGSPLTLAVAVENSSYVPIELDYVRVAGFLDGELVTSWNGSRVADTTIEPGATGVATITIPVQPGNRETVREALADASLTVTGSFDFVLRNRVIRKSVAFEGIGDE